MSKKPDLPPKEFEETFEARILKEWSIETRAIIIGIIIQSLLQSLANALFPEKSLWIIIFWLIVLIVISILFIFLDKLMRFIRQDIINPIYTAVHSKSTQQVVNAKATIPFAKYHNLNRNF